MKTDKQLLALNKTDLLKEYRKLEASKSNKEPTLEEAIKIVKSHDMIVRKKQDYNF
jgi:hypothetical protein